MGKMANGEWGQLILCLSVTRVTGEEAGPGVSGFGRFLSHGLCLPKSRNIDNGEWGQLILCLSVTRVTGTEAGRGFRDLEDFSPTACACRNPETSKIPLTISQGTTQDSSTSLSQFAISSFHSLGSG